MQVITQTLKQSLLTVLVLSLFATAALAQETAANETAPVTVLSFKWAKERRALELADPSSQGNTPQREMIPQNRNFARQTRVNDPAGVRDPNADTIDGRSAELERITSAARESKPQADGFTYQTKVQNNAAKLITAVFWEYQFREQGTARILSRRQFVCQAKVKPAKTRDFEIFSLTAPSSVISVKSLNKKSEPVFDETVLINRVEFEDGSTWQRPNWNYDEVKLTAKPASTAKKLQPCRGL